MRAGLLALAVLLVAVGIAGAYAFGEMIERSLPGSYHDSAPSVYAWVGVMYGAFGTVLMLSGLYLASVGLRDSYKLPALALAFPALVLAGFLPYARWIGDAGYGVNVLFNLLAVAVLVAFARGLLSSGAPRTG